MIKDLTTQSIYKLMNQFPVINTTEHFTIDETGSMLFTPEGMYSQSLFGPIKKLSCECEQLTGSHNEGEVCSECKVMCTETEIRKTRWCAINLGGIILNPLFDITVSHLLGKKVWRKMIAQSHLSVFNYGFDRTNFKLVELIELDEHAPKGNHIIKLGAFTNIPKIIKYCIDNDAVGWNGLKAVENILFIRQWPVMPAGVREISIRGADITESNYSAIMAQMIVNNSIPDQHILCKMQYNKCYEMLFSEEIGRVGIAPRFMAGKNSEIRRAVVGKPISSIATNVITPDPTIPPWCISIDKKTAMTLYDMQVNHEVLELSKVDGNPLVNRIYVNRLYNKNMHVSDTVVEQAKNNLIDKINTASEKMSIFPEYSMFNNRAPELLVTNLAYYQPRIREIPKINMNMKD